MPKPIKTLFRGTLKFSKETIKCNTKELLLSLRQVKEANGAVVQAEHRVCESAAASFKSPEKGEKLTDGQETVCRRCRTGSDTPTELFEHRVERSRFNPVICHF